MLTLIELLIFLFGTAFIVGFITYGLKDNLNSPSNDEQPKSDLPEKDTKKQPKSGLSEKDSENKSKSDPSEKGTEKKIEETKGKTSSSETPIATSPIGVIPVVDDSGAQIPPAEATSPGTESANPTLEATTITPSAD